jgi:hypothetical protein
MACPLFIRCTLLYVIAMESALTDASQSHAIPAVDIERLERLERHSSQCHRSINQSQVIELLERQPCARNSKQTSRVGKRNVIASGTVDIHALQTTVNDHHTLINNIVNNSLNTSILADAINRHNAQRPPMFSEWRDCVDMACIALFIGGVVYLLMCRTGCVSCSTIMAYFLRPVATHLNRQIQAQTQSPEVIETISHKVQPIVMDTHRYNRGYSSD